MKVAGTCYFKVNGAQHSLRGNVAISIGNTARESVVGLDGYHGIKEEPQASSIEVDLTDRPDIDLNQLETLVDQTITVELINGKVAILRDAAQVEKISLNPADGTFKVKFEGPRGEWLAA